jgi:hypothetical protein
MGLIIVGVDQSAGAKEALRFAVEEAQFRQATLRVVHAWQFSSLAAPTKRYNPSLTRVHLAAK